MTLQKAIRHSILAICLCSLAGPFAFNAAHAQGTPVGLWDFVLSGRQRGVAHVAFFEDGTLDGVVVFTFNGKALTRTNNSATYVFTNRFGGARIEGDWIYERTNRITGFMNLLPLTDPEQTNVTFNGLSFRGTAKATRVNLLAYGPQGQVALKGVPFSETNIVDLGGSSSFLGTAKIRSIPFPFLEIFTLTTEGPNMYQVAGGGPGYDYTGLFLVSNQRYAAFYQDRGEGPDGPLLSAYAGPFNVLTRRGSMIGTDGVYPVIRYRIIPEAP